MADSMHGCNAGTVIADDSKRYQDMSLILFDVLFRIIYSTKQRYIPVTQRLSVKRNVVLVLHYRAGFI